ncbi:MAG TPA: carboxypeptidase M32, partial [Herpetosiphonaceae bacterium]
LYSTLAVLGWDQKTYMPAGGAQGRAEQMATLSKIAHEMMTSDKTGQLLDSVHTEGLDPDSDDARLVDVVTDDYERSLKLPAEFVARFSKARALSNQAWQRARADKDFPGFQADLETIVGLVREEAGLLGYDAHPYDALLDSYERGLTTAQVASVFDELKRGTVPLVRAIADLGDDGRDACLHQPFDEGRQEAFGVEVVSRFGYDWSRGRQDRTAHPFCTQFGRNDVRITTRFNPDWLAPALFGTLHETGHALYEQGVKPELSRTPLERGASLGIHESQSRLWENLIGRSLPFWTYFYPRLQEFFPEQLGKVDLTTFYRAINAVKPSLIRVEADEVTYNLHVMIRFELEQQLVAGTLPIADLPAAWNAKYEEYLGVTPPDAALGVLQDVHWSGGMIGYFPTYTFGNVLSVQFFEAAVAAHPEINDEIGRGEFGTLYRWLQENIYQHGRKFKPNELVTRVTGRPMEAAPYVRYLKQKFAPLYGIDAGSLA